jgi:hypothetical protein
MGRQSFRLRGGAVSGLSNCGSRATYLFSWVAISSADRRREGKRQRRLLRLGIACGFVRWSLGSRGFLDELCYRFRGYEPTTANDDAGQFAVVQQSVNGIARNTAKLFPGLFDRIERTICHDFLTSPRNEQVRRWMGPPIWAITSSPSGPSL